MMLKRKRTRLKEYDYSAPGVYFITICTKGRKKILSEIIVGDGVLDVPQNMLTDFGKIAERYLLEMSDFYQTISVDTFVIMPNHIHLLLSISETDGLPNGTSRTPSPTNSTVARFVSTFKRFCNKEFGENIWQRSFHDHIIRDANDYQKIWEYIDTNPAKWEEDCFYHEKEAVAK